MRWLRRRDEFTVVKANQRFCAATCRARVLGIRPHNWDNRSTPKSTRYATVEHRDERRRRAARHAEADPCSRCGEALGPMGPHLHLDHTDDGSGYLGFAHGTCNQRAGARAARARQDEKAST